MNKLPIFSTILLFVTVTNYNDMHDRIDKICYKRTYSALLRQPYSTAQAKSVT